MALKKVALIFFLGMLFINLPIHCMQETIEENQTTLESLPNEVLLLILQHKIQNIINKKNKAIQRLERFKQFLSSICLTNKRFYGFKDNLEKYFEENAPAGVSDVVVDINEDADEHKLSFNIIQGTNKYNFEIDTTNKATIQKFVEDIKNISKTLLQEIGTAIYDKIKTANKDTTDNNISAVLNYILEDIYKQANKDCKNKLRFLAQNILSFFSKKGNLDHKNLEKIFDLYIEKEINKNDHRYDEAS